MYSTINYFFNCHRLQVFHCLRHEGTGGLNSLVDGYKLAEEIREDEPEIYETLSKTLIPWQYIEPDKYFFYNVAPILSHNLQTGQLECFRYTQD